MSDCANGGRWPRWGKVPRAEYEPHRLALEFDRGSAVETTVSRHTDDGPRTLLRIRVDGEPWGPLKKRDYDVQEMD